MVALLPGAAMDGLSALTAPGQGRAARIPGDHKGRPYKTPPLDDVTRFGSASRPQDDPTSAS